MVLFVKRVGIIGGGIMGSQIADIMAINGKEVIIRDISEDYTKKAMEIVDNNLTDLVQFHSTRAEKEIERIESRDGIQLSDEQKEKIKEVLKPKFNQEQKAETISRISTTTNIEDFNDVDLVIEAVVENIEVKKEVFNDLDTHTPKHAILASNTSSLSITEIALSLIHI